MLNENYSKSKSRPERLTIKSQEVKWKKYNDWYW